jgi:hypothetical protein
MTKPKSFADIKKLKRPNEVTVELVLDPEISRVITELSRRYEIEKRKDSKQNRPPEAPALLKELEALQLQAEEAKTVFIFKDPGRRKFDALVDSCPPSDEQKKEKFQWDPDKFVPALIALASSDPAITTEDAQEIYDDWGRGDVEALFNTALQACLEVASVPFTKRDTDAILDSVRNLITQPNEESPTPSI